MNLSTFEIFFANIQRELHKYIGTEGITPEQWEILSLIHATGKIRQSTIIKLTQKDKANISRSLARLKDRGLIHSVQDKDVTRTTAVFLTLTETGRQIFDRLPPEAVERKLDELLGEDLIRAISAKVSTIPVTL